MKVRYIGKTTIPLALAIGTIPVVTHNEIYEVVLNNKESDCYVIVDDNGMNSVIRKELCEELEGNNECV